MADEISARLVVTPSIPGETPFQPPAATYDCATGIIERGTQVVGTTPEVLALGDATAGPVGFYNADATNFVEVGRMISAAFEPFGKVSPGGIGWLEIADSVTWYVQADTASVELKRFVPSAAP